MNFKQYKRETYSNNIENSAFQDRENYIRYYDTYYSSAVKRYFALTPGTLPHLYACNDLLTQYKKDYEALKHHILEVENLIKNVYVEKVS